MPHDVTSHDSATIMDAVRVSSRHYLASEHLWSALHNARRCGQLEDELVNAGVAFDMEHQSCAITAIMSSVAFAEALVNEVFQDAADLAESRSNSRIAAFDERTVTCMQEFWNASEGTDRYVGVLDKFQLALVFAGCERFDRGVDPF